MVSRMPLLQTLLPLLSRRRLIGAALAMSALAHPAPARAGLLDDVPVGLGFAAWDLCTRVLAIGDDGGRVRTRYTGPKVSPLPWIWRVRQGADEVEVKTWLHVPGWRRLAVHRPGLGCTLLPPGVDRATWLRTSPALKPPVMSLAPGAIQAGRPWPQGDGPAEAPPAHTALPIALERASAALFAETTDNPRARQNTQAVLVLHQGRLIHERYAPGYGPDSLLPGWSMTKSLTALWAGALLGRGVLALDQPLGLPVWAGTEKAGITWRHALNLAPGLAWDEGHSGFSSVSDMLFSHGDHAAYAAAMPMEAAPGTRFNYSTGTSALLGAAIRHRLGGDAQRALDSLWQDLLAPLGVRAGFVEPDATGTPAAGARGVLRPRDWLRLGELVRREGQWQGRTVVPPGFVAFMRAPSPANAGYGAGLRLYDPALMPATVPRDVAYFTGLMGQFMVILPSQQLVLLRMGVSLDKEETRRRVFDAALALVRASQEPREPVLAQAAGR
jgi:CubicO group peptidase (beta-lactamase class C family)